MALNVNKILLISVLGSVLLEYTYSKHGFIYYIYNGPLPIATIKNVCQPWQVIHVLRLKSLLVPFGQTPQRKPKKMI